MTGLFSAKRRADEFEALLSRAPETPLTDREVERFAALLSLVSDLRAVPDAMPRPEFAGSLRERLMTEADTVLLPQPTRNVRGFGDVQPVALSQGAGAGLEVDFE